MGKFFTLSTLYNRIAFVMTSLLLLWSLGYVLYSGSTQGKEFYKDIASGITGDGKAGVPVINLALPLLLAGSLCSIFLVESSVQVSIPFSRSWSANKLSRMLTGGDLDLWYFNVVFLLIPCTVYVLSVIYRHFHNGLKSTDKYLMEGANSFGMMAEVAMAFFLVPVSKGFNPLLVVFGLDPIYATKIHIWAGRIGAFGVIVHGVGHCLRWFLDEELTVLGEIWPPQSCWNGVASKYCYNYFRNLTGIISGIAFSGILMTSLEFIRRRYYRVFYACHMIFMPIVFGAAIMHHPRLIFYLCPGILYYFATSMPMIMQLIANYSKGGTRLLSVKHIPYSGNCVEMCFEADAFVAQNKAAQYVRLRIPQVALAEASHPFTIVPSPADPTSLRIIFRETGKFTKELSRQLASTWYRERLVFLLDGIYSGPDRLQQALHHDSVVMVAGGIGITPFISLMFSLFSHLDQSTAFKGEKVIPMTNSVTLHWVCRDEGLIQHVITNYFSQLFSDGSLGSNMSRRDFPTFRIIIHHTSPELVQGNGSDISRVPVLACFTIDDEDEKEDESSSPQSEERAPDDQIESEVVVCNQSGVKFETAHFAPCRQSVVGNLPSFVLFSSIGFLSLMVLWRHYESEILPNKYSTSVRVWGLLIASLLSVLLSIAAEVLIGPHLSSFQNFIVSWRSKPANADSIDVQLSQMDAARVSSEDDSQHHRALHAVKHGDEECKVTTIQHSRGRLSESELLPYLNESDFPALFLCGPTNLLKSVRSAVRTSEGFRSCGIQEKRCAIYTESFEL